METIKAKRFTRSSLVKFIKENKDNLYIMVKSDFDGMTDCVQSVNMVPTKVDASKINLDNRDTLGISGAWLVGSSRDWFTPFEDEMFVGVHVSNCCGSWSIGRMK